MPKPINPDFDLAAAVDEALAFEEAHGRARSRVSQRSLEKPIEQANDDPEDRDKLVSDMPWDPLELGRALDACATPPGEGRVDEISYFEACVKADDNREGSTLRDLPADLDPHDLAETGWGLILPAGDRGDALRDALKPLWSFREEQAGPLFKDDLPRYRPGVEASQYLWNVLDLAPGVVDVEKVPYYLLIAGGPEDVPFAVQYALAVEHAVGRIAFDDLGDYRQWAKSVVDAESAPVGRAKRTTMLAVEDGTSAMDRVGTQLIDPIADRLGQYMEPWPDKAQWPVDVRRRQNATKAGFLRALVEPDAPGLALLAAHGLSLTHGNPHQRALQGAFCSQPTGRKQHLAERLVVGADIDALATDENWRPLHGLIAFLFTCYGAGTPRDDDFPQVGPEGFDTAETVTAGRLAEASFMAALPQAMLRQGALAIVGHVDRGWTLSFSWTLAGRMTDGVRSLEDGLKQLVRGHRLGHALRALNRRHNAIASHMSELLNQKRRGVEPDLEKLAVQWTAHHDARNTIVLGDPAVYLSGQRLEGPGCTCGQRVDSPEPVYREFRSLPETTDGTVLLSPDVQRHARAEAERLGIDISSWVDTLIRHQATRSPTLRG